MPNLRVSFNKIEIGENGDNAGATWKFEMYVNGQRQSWHPDNVVDHTPYDLSGRVFDQYVPDNGALTVNTGGYEEDSPGFPVFDDHDAIYGINQRYTNADNWGIGNHSVSAGGDGLDYVISYVIENTGPQVHVIRNNEWISAFTKSIRERISRKQGILELIKPGPGSELNRIGLEQDIARSTELLNAFVGANDDGKFSTLLAQVTREGWEVVSFTDAVTIIKRG